VHFTPTQPLGPGNLIAVMSFPPEGIVNVVCRFRLVDGSEHYAEIPRNGRNQYSGIVHLSERLTSVVLEVSGSGYPYALREFVLQPLIGLRRIQPFVQRLFRVGLRAMRRLPNASDPKSEGAVRSWADYRLWRDRFDERPEVDQDLHRGRALLLREGPLISLIIYAGSEPDRCEGTIASLLAQFYQHWELIVLTHGLAAQLQQRLFGASKIDPRITIVTIDACRAEAYNQALARARGDLIAVVPPRARLPAHALTEIAWAFEGRPGVELLYTDEDRIDAKGRRGAPRFKPDWSPDFLRSRDYLGDLTFYRTGTLRRLGGWRPVAGAEDYDLKLRFTDAVSSAPGGVQHLPQVLINLPNAFGNGESATNAGLVQARSEHLSRRALDHLWDASSGRVKVRRGASALQSQVSIIIPTRDQGALLRTCVQSILERTDYGPYEVLIVDNGSQEAETNRVFEELSQDERVRVLQYPYPFNYSAINNYAVGHARGAFLALLNNDVEVVEPTWLSDMVAHASRKEIGCVGAKLLYPDGTVQHGGILLGVAGLAGHAHRYAAATAAGYLGRLQSVLNVPAVTAACLVVRHEIFDEVGGLDEASLATAFNDVDFCLKVRAAGYLNLWSPNAVLIHHESKSRGYERTPAKRARLAHEEDVMRRRWGRALLEDPYYSPHLTRMSEDFRPRRV
jgi:GT2 family glycosyltransferase